MKKDIIQQWEDGLRTSGKFGEYEWWYFDVKLDGGYSLVIIFYSQPVTAASPGFVPCVSLSLTGNEYEMLEEVSFKLKDCHFSKDGCDVKIGNNTFKGDLKNYTIHFENDRVNCDVTLEGLAQSYRHHTGEIFFGESKYFAWLPSVPEGKVTADITVDGKKLALNGSGYHDHNWGNIGMFWLMHHWYWGRAKVGEYHFRITYSAEDIIETFVVDQGYGSARAKASKALIWFVKKMKLAPSYIRMVGTITLERFEMTL